MGGGNYNMNSTQFEFLKEETYTRKGGCYVTTPKAILYVIIAIISLIIVALSMYYYGPYSTALKTIENTMDIEKLLNYSVGNISQDIRLPKDLEPTFYQLKIDPKINEENNRSIFEGEVTIRFKCKRKTKTILLNAENLNVTSVGVFRIDSIQNRSKRDVLNNKNEDINEDFLNSSNLTNINTSNVDLTDLSLNLSNSTDSLNSNLSNDDKTTTSFVSSSESTTFNDFKLPEEVTEPSEVMGKDRIDKIHRKMPEEILLKSELNITDHKNDEGNLKYSIKLKKDLEKDKDYLVKITFNSNITEAFHGLYKIIDDKKLILVTKLHPIYARKLFPCFDEPNFKAPFQLTLKKSNKNETILTNSDPFKSFKDENGSIWEEFQITNSIPTYSLGFIIGDLIKIEEEEIRKDCVVRIWSFNNQNDLIKSGSKKVFNIVKKVLVYSEKYFLIDFPSEKVDLVFVKDLRFTTPNSGLILLSELLILNEKDLFSELSKSLTKEWIGNLVSISWWDDFWFINAFSIFILEDLQLSEDFNTDFTLEITQETLQSDDLKSALSLESKVENAIQIFDITDKNKYNKGACLLKMINSSLAPLTFQKGIQNFIRDWKNNSTDIENLWKSLDLVITKVDKLPEDETISKIIQTWSSQPSFPLISVLKSFQNDTLIINQRKFHSNLNDSEDNLWSIPISYMTGNGNNNVEEKSFWLTKKVQIEEVKNLKSKWILFNLNYNGYYRVNYDLENWKMLTNTLHDNHLKIPIVNRGQLINDAFELAENGFLDYHVPFNLTRYLINETDYVPWASALKSLEFIKSILETTYLNGDYEDYITNLIGSIYDKIKETNPNENEIKETKVDEINLKKLIIETACSVHYPSCTKWALEKLQDFLKQSKNVNFRYRKTILCTGIRLSGRKEWENIFSRLKSNENEDVEDLYAALGCTKHAWLINKYLSATLNGTIPIKYVSNVWKSIRNVPARNFGFKFLRENWERIYEAYKEKRLILKTIIQDFLYHLSTKSDKEDLTLFFGKFNENLQGFSYLLKGVVDQIDSRIIWKEKHLESIDKWFSSR